MVSIAFFGRGESASDALRYALDLGVEVKAVVYPGNYIYEHIERVAREYNLPIYSYKDFKSEDITIDFIISYLYPHKIEQIVLNKAKYGGINFHPAPLPESKGLFGYNFAIYEGKTQWGVSAHYMTDKFDDGRLIQVLRFDIVPEVETVKTLKEKSHTFLYLLYQKVIRDIANGVVPEGHPQGDTGVMYNRPKFEKLKRINFEEHDLREVKKRIRACWYPPYEGAYIVHEGEKLFLVDRETLKRLGDLKYDKR